MPSSGAIKSIQGQVKPILSLSKEEARRRVINLYRAWYRHIPDMMTTYDMPISEKQAHDKLREMFEQNRHVTDIRVIDMLVIKGQMELSEVVNQYKQVCHIMNYFKETHNPKPKDFISKFLAGKNSD